MIQPPGPLRVIQTKPTVHRILKSRTRSRANKRLNEETILQARSNQTTIVALLNWDLGRARAEETRNQSWNVWTPTTWADTSFRILWEGISRAYLKCTIQVLVTCHSHVYVTFVWESIISQGRSIYVGFNTLKWISDDFLIFHKFNIMTYFIKTHFIVYQGTPKKTK